jgi:AraC family transcriptional regulator
VLAGRQVYCVGKSVPHEVRWERESSWIETLLHGELIEAIRPELVTAVLARDSLDGTAHDLALWEIASKIRYLCCQPEQPNLHLIEPMIIALVRRVFACHGERYAPKHGCCLSEDRTQIVTDYMEENVSKRIDASVLASLVRLSVQHFTELFRNRTGRPPIEYLRELRRIKAHDMIFRGEMRMGEIADACGFCDEPHLNREFKKFFGYSAKLLRTRGRSAPSSVFPVGRS